MSRVRDRNVVRRYLDEQQAKNLAEGTLCAYAARLLKASKAVDKPFEKWVRVDCAKFLKEIANRNSNNFHGILLKSFMRWLGKEEVMTWWKPKRPSMNLPAFPTHDEIERILKEMDLEYRSLFRVVADSGARIGDILTLKSHQVHFDKHGAIITLQSEKTTQGLRLRLVSSAPILSDWITRSPRLPDGRVWDISYMSANRHFHMARKRAGIEKLITIHSLRHARATEFARSGMSEILMRRQFGWAPGSRMVERYAHLGPKELDDAVLRANGIKPPAEEAPIIFKPVICPMCNAPNDPTYPICINCSADLTRPVASVDELLGVMSKVLDTELLTKDIDKILGDIGEKHPEGLVEDHTIAGNEAVLVRTLIGLGAVSQKITQGLMVLSRGTKQLEAAAEVEQEKKKFRKPRARGRAAELKDGG
jgi:integrase